jgi:transcription initiation factor TFIID TATA-box-binding protein
VSSELDVDDVNTDTTNIVPEWKVENVVATVTMDISGMGGKIDLTQVLKHVLDCEYNPERFPGLVMRIEKPKATILLFTTGKMVVTGLRQADDAPLVTDIFIRRLKHAKIHVGDDPLISIQNIVASGDLHVPIDLNEAAIQMENAMYEPEVFPGLIYRMPEPKTVFLMFSTGRIVCTGAKTREMVGDAIGKLVQYVISLGVVGQNEFELDDDEVLFIT